MARIHAFELEDQAWFPRFIRDAGTAFLRFGAENMGQAKQMRPVVEEALARSGETEILDLCSGGGGPVVAIARELRQAGSDVRVTLTDLFPSASAQELVDRTGDDHIAYESSPVDATVVPAERAGLRTLFNAFHHFRPDLATRVLANAVESRRSIAVVEVLQRRALALFGMLFVPIMTLFIVPFLRPFRVSWLLFTYLIPIIPLFIWWDGSVSVLRAYSRDELLGLAARADPDGLFDWRVEEVPMSPSPVPGLALIGVPKV